MVLGAHVALHSLAVVRGGSVNVLTSVVASDKRYSLDVGVSADVCHGVSATLDNVDDAIGHSGLLEEIEEDLHGSGDLLRGLHDVGVTEGDGQREHPQGAHGREVEGSDTSAHTEGHSVAVEVNTLGDVAEGLALGEGGEAASVLDDLEASEDITLGVNETLTVLLSDDGSDFVLVNRRSC